MNTTTEEQGELVVLPEAELKNLFDGSAMEPLLKGIEDTARSFVLDATTKTGREQIASVAHKVAKAKTAIDGAGKELVSGIKEQAKVIDGERKKARDFLDNLKADIRKPLTDFENAEKERVAELEARLQRLKDCMSDLPDTLVKLEYLLERLQLLDSSTFAEYSETAEATKIVAIGKVSEAIESAKKREEEAAELEKLRAEKAEREQQDREEAIRKEAEEKAKREAEEAHAKELAKQKAEAEAREAKIKEEAEAEKRKAEAEAKREREEQARREYEEKKLQEDESHRMKIQGEIYQAFLKGGVSEGDAKLVVTLVLSGTVPNLSINY